MDSKIKDNMPMQSGELSDDELNNVSGGGCKGEDKPKSFACPSCGADCTRMGMSNCYMGTATENYQCPSCGQKFDVIYVDAGCEVVKK